MFFTTVFIWFFEVTIAIVSNNYGHVSIFGVSIVMMSWAYPNSWLVCDGKSNEETDQLGIPPCLGKS